MMAGMLLFTVCAAFAEEPAAAEKPLAVPAEEETPLAMPAEEKSPPPLAMPAEEKPPPPLAIPAAEPVPVAAERPPAIPGPAGPPPPPPPRRHPPKPEKRERSFTGVAGGALLTFGTTQSLMANGGFRHWIDGERFVYEWGAGLSIGNVGNFSALLTVEGAINLAFRTDGHSPFVGAGMGLGGLGYGNDFVGVMVPFGQGGFFFRRRGAVTVLSARLDMPVNAAGQPGYRVPFVRFGPQIGFGW